MRHILQTAFLAIGLMVISIGAQADQPVVVELYTSQGCSSCPPADKILGQFTKRKDVIPLALHVDYWDYIGWKDEFADPRFSDRQRRYARLGQRRVVYTPQMIIGGHTNIEGARKGEINAAIEKARRELSSIDLRLQRRGDRLIIRADRASLNQEAEVHLVRFAPSKTVKILRGENRGRTLTYSNVVTQWETIGDWDGRSNLMLRADVKGDDHIAVLIQYPGPGRMVAAAQLR